MVKTKSKNAGHYYCKECKMAYADKKKACECEDWCRKNKSCNTDIIKHAVMKGGKSKNGK